MRGHRPHLGHKVEANSSECSACSGLLDEAGGVVEEGGRQADSCHVAGVEAQATLQKSAALVSRAAHVDGLADCKQAMYLAAPPVCYVASTQNSCCSPSLAQSNIKAHTNSTAMQQIGLLCSDHHMPAAKAHCSTHGVECVWHARRQGGTDVDQGFAFLSDRHLMRATAARIV